MRNIKEETIICCGVDGDMLRLCPGKYSLYYRCPRYEFKNRNRDEKVCMNRLSLSDAEIIYSVLEDMEDEGRLKAGESGRIMHLAYEIAEVNEMYIKVYVINHKKVKLL